MLIDLERSVPDSEKPHGWDVEARLNAALWLTRHFRSLPLSWLLCGPFMVTCFMTPRPS